MHTMSKRATRLRIRQRDTAIDACHPAILAETGDRDPARMAVFGNRRHTAAAVVAFLWPNYENFAMPHHFLALLVFALAMLFSGSGIAGLQEGLDALRKGDYAAAAKELRPLAERGDTEAQYRLGLMYEFGKGFRVDKPQAMVWLGKSAEHGNPSAQTELGVIYATGD